MAKIIAGYWHILFLCVSCCSCVSKAGITDTPPEDANSIALHNVIPIKEGTPDTTTQFVKVGKKIEKQVVISPISSSDLHAAVQKVYTRNIGVRELTGNNDGFSIGVYLQSVGLHKDCKCPYCAAFVHFCLERGGVKNSITAWSPTSFNKKNPVWYQRKFIKEPKAADVVSFYFPAMKRIAHCGFFDKEINSSIYESVEGNTSNSSGIDRDGGGVYRKKRSYNSTFAISRWIKD